MLYGSKVVLPKEAERLDQLGSDTENFVEEAGKKVAAHALLYTPKKVTLLVGKGNKGADALAAGLYLISFGVEVHAIMLFSFKEASSYNQKLYERFQKVGKIFHAKDAKIDSDLIIDGLFGTGFKDKLSIDAEKLILMANTSHLPILSIDIPSGVDGTTGEVKSVAIYATKTIAMGFAKVGCFLREGWNHTGELVVVDFGLPKTISDKAEFVAGILDEKQLSLPKITRSRHKYEAGYLIGFSGSELFQGAPKLAGLAALRMGAGIVRVFHKGNIGNFPFELICQKWNKKTFDQELLRASAVFTGPGLGKENLKWLEKIKKPLVVDADALQKNISYPKGAILTPHRGEMARVLGFTLVPREEDLFEKCGQYVERHEVVLLLKGAPTFLFAKGKKPLIVTRGDPGMATAGTGDVLTGMIGALIAQKMSPYQAAALGAYLHGLAGEMAAKKKTSYGLIASDLIDTIPEALRTMFPWS